MEKTINWSKLVQRQESVLLVDQLVQGVTTNNTKRVVGWERGFESYLYLDKNIYWDSEEASKVTDYAKEHIANTGYLALLTTAKKWRKIGQNLLKLSRRLETSSYAKYDNNQLIKDLQLFSKQNCQLSTALLLPLVVEKCLAKEIEDLLVNRGVSEDKRKEYLDALIFPKKESYSTKELTSFYKIAAVIQSNVSPEDWNINKFKTLLQKRFFSNLINGHLKEFGWIGARWYLGSAWSADDLLARVASLNPTDNFLLKRKELSDLIKYNNQLTNQVIKNLSLTKSDVQLINATKEFVFLRTYRTDIFNKVGYSARPLLSEMAKRINLNYEDIIFLTSEEIIDALKINKPSVGELIRERQQGFGSILEDGKVKAFSGKQLAEFKQYLEGVQEEFNREISGMAANKGLASGPVKVIKNADDLTSIVKGDILVAPMTTPDYVPYMELASAFITDEGGITCHAAIVSRELKKPCIIGTKIATKVLKDGDMVEVDADKGVVKKIS